MVKSWIFSPKGRKKTKISTLITSIQHCTWGPSWGSKTWKSKNNKIQGLDKKSKTGIFFRWYDCLYRESRIIQRQIIRTMKEISQLEIGYSYIKSISKTNWSYNTWMDETWKHEAKWKKPDTKGQWFRWYEMPGVGTPIATESRLSCQGREMRSDC